MKVKHLVVALFLVLLCAVTVNNANEADAAVATWCTVNHNIGSSNQIAVGGSVTFTMASNGNTHTLWIYNISKGTSAYYQNAGTSYTLTFSEAGKYEAMVQAWGDNGSCPTSTRIAFYVGVPTKSTLDINYSAVPTGTSITFTMNGDGATNTLWIYAPNGTTHYDNAGSSKSLSFTTPGNYSALMETWNGAGSKKSNYCYFTVVDTSGGLSASLAADNSNTIVHGNVKFTVTINNTSYLPINNLSFKVTANNGSETLTLYTVSGNSGSNGTGTTASKTGALGDIAARSSLTITLTVNSDDGNFDDNTTYNVQVTSGSGNLVGLSTGSTARSFSATGTKSFKPTSGSVSLGWSASVTGGSIVEGTYTYTITFTNNTNHAITGIDYTLKYGSTTVISVSNGKVTASGCATANKTDLGNVNSGGNVQLVVTIDTTKLTDSTGYTFTLAGGTCNATGIAGSNAGYGLNANFSGTHAITVRGGGVTMTWTPSVTTGSVVEGTYTYTIKFTNNTNHAINGIDFKLKNGSTAIVTVTNMAVSKTGDYVTINKTSLGDTLAKGASVELVVTIDATKLTDKTGYTFTLDSGSSNATGITGSNSTIELKPSTNSYTHSITVAGGGVSLTWSPSIDSGKVVEGTYTYTITFTNNTNHTITGIDYTLKEGGTALVTVTDGSVTVNASSYVTANKTSLGNVNAGGNVQLVVTVDTTKLSDGSSHTYTLAGGTSNATGIAGSNSGYGQNAGQNTNHSFTVRSGGVTMTWTPSIDSGKVVEGTYYYDITFTNGTNHTITGIDYTIKIGDTTVITVSNGAVTSNKGYATVNKESLGDLASGASVTLRVTIDASKMTDGGKNTFTLANGSSNATGIAGSNASIELKPSTNSYSHTMTVRKGDITVSLGATGLTSGNVGEGTVEYTVTLENDTNHTLKDISFTLTDSNGNALLTVNSNGTITVNNSTLVKNGGTLSGSLTSLAAGETVTISGIKIDADADVLDATGRLILTANGSALSKDVVGSAADYPYADSSDSFTIMVRHDVDLIVQSGRQTTISAEKIFAAMNKSGAYGPEKANGLTADAITAIAIATNTGASTSVSGVSISSSKNLVVKLTAIQTKLILQVTYNGNTVLVPLQVNTYSAGKDKTYVLDYGLPVSIDDATMLDDIRLTGGAYSNAANTIKGFSAAMSGAGALDLDGKFGTFNYNSDGFNYIPSEFMNDADITYITILIGDASGTENVDFVNIYKKVSFIPSNVMYYEDTLIGSIDYPDGYTLVELGNLSGTGVTGVQDLPTTGHMGFDDGSYANAKDVMLSGESVQKVTVDDEAVSVFFDFTGTGFELISRVNANDAATLVVTVTFPNGDIKHYPVITRFNPNDSTSTEVYQVPVFRLNNGEYGKYKVEVKGLPNQEIDANGGVISTKTSYIYVDGIRIYNPLGDGDLTKYYGDEQGAQFTNLRDLILNGQGVVAEFNGSVTGFTSGDYYYIGSGKRYTAALGSINELGAIGANNEILVRREDNNYVVVLQVKETTEGAGLLQIGVHDIHDAKFDGTSGDNASTTISYKTETGWETLVSNTYSGTEQYYNIDLSKCPTDGGNKIVILQVDNGFASFSNVKHKNVEFSASFDKALDIYVESGYYFNKAGDMCYIDETTKKEVVKIPAADLINMNTVNTLLSQDAGEND